MTGQSTPLKVGDKVLIDIETSLFPQTAAFMASRTPKPALDMKSLVETMERLKVIAPPSYVGIRVNPRTLVKVRDGATIVSDSMTGGIFGIPVYKDVDIPDDIVRFLCANGDIKDINIGKAGE